MIEMGEIPGRWIETTNDPFRRVRPSNDDGRLKGLFTLMRESTPKLRAASDKKLGGFLRKWGFTDHKHSSGRSWRGWMFPDLQDLRRQWTEKVGHRDWQTDDWWIGETAPGQGEDPY